MAVEKNSIQKQPPQTFAEITPAILAAWKTQNPRGLYQLDVEHEKIPTGKKDKNGEPVYETTYKSCIVRKPTREEMKYAMTLAKADDELGMVEEILTSCWLGGDRELLEDDDYFYGAAMQLKGLIEIRAGELKKL